MTQECSVGIDLGTTFSSLAWVDGAGHVESLRLSNGTYTVASAVYFKSKSVVIVGSEAYDYALMYPDRVARKFKRDMCKEGADFECDGRKYRPQELSAMILKKLLKEAEPVIGPVRKAVISVPFVFDDARRQATIDAGRIAGLDEVELVDEPVAAGIAYGNKLFSGHRRFADQELEEMFTDETLLVYDLGGGTFDATIMRLGKDAKFEVIATAGDWELGGEDWDDVLLNAIVDAYELSIGEDVRTCKEHMQELRRFAIDAKKTLSERPRVDLNIAVSGSRATVTLSRGDFERDSLYLLTRTTDTVSEMLRDNQMDWNYIDRILLVGGSSRMPMVHKQLHRITGREFDMSLPPDTAIAQGAALFAAFHAGNANVSVSDVVTVNSHPIGLAVHNRKTNRVVNDVILKANTPTLTAEFREYDVPDPDLGVQLVILLGNDDPSACARLGRVWITGIPKGARKPKVRVSYCFQENGMLAVEGVVIHKGGQPIKAKTELAIEGKMPEDEVEDAVQTLKGIDFA